MKFFFWLLFTITFVSAAYMIVLHSRWQTGNKESFQYSDQYKAKLNRLMEIKLQAEIRKKELENNLFKCRNE